MTLKPTNRNPNHGIQTVRWSDHKSRRFDPDLFRNHRTRLARAVRYLRVRYGRVAYWPLLARTNYLIGRNYAGIRHTGCPYIDRLESCIKPVAA